MQKANNVITKLQAGGKRPPGHKLSCPIRSRLPTYCVQSECRECERCSERQGVLHAGNVSFLPFHTAKQCNHCMSDINQQHCQRVNVGIVNHCMSAQSMSKCQHSQSVNVSTVNE